MDEFEKIKTFSESLVERQQNMAQGQEQEQKTDLDLPKYLSQFRAVPVQEERESKRFLWVALILGGVIAVGTVFALSQRFSSMEEQEIVVISPTPQPVKVLPENPGGLNIPDRDKVVFNRGNESHKEMVIENLFPETEQPQLPAEVIEPENKEEDIISPVLVETSTEILSDPAEAPIESQEKVVLAESDVRPGVEVAPEPEVVLEAPHEDIKKIEVEPPKEEVKKLEEEPKKNTVVWRAQLLSSSNKNKVDSSWKQILQKHKALLSDMPYQIISATIPGKGTFWRLQVGEFATKEMATNLCAKLKKKKQDCIPVK